MEVRSSCGLWSVLLISLRKAPQEEMTVHSPIFLSSQNRTWVYLISQINEQSVFSVVRHLSFLSSITNSLPRNNKNAQEKFIGAGWWLQVHLRDSKFPPTGPRKDPGAAQALSCPLAVTFQNFVADYADVADILPCTIQWTFLCLTHIYLACRTITPRSHGKIVMKKKPWPMWQSQFNWSSWNLWILKYPKLKTFVNWQVKVKKKITKTPQLLPHIHSRKEKFLDFNCSHFIWNTSLNGQASHSSHSRETQEATSICCRETEDGTVFLPSVYTDDNTIIFGKAELTLV